MKFLQAVCSGSEMADGVSRYCSGASLCGSMCLNAAMRAEMGTCRRVVLKAPENDATTARLALAGGYWRAESAEVVVRAWEQSGEALTAFARRHGYAPSPAHALAGSAEAGFGAGAFQRCDGPGLGGRRR